MAIQLILTFQKEKKNRQWLFQATCRVFIRHRSFLCLLRRILLLTFGSLWLVFPATRILHENLEPGAPSSFFLLPVLEFHAFPLPHPKKMLPLKKNGKKRSLITGDHYAILWLLLNAFLAAHALLTQSLVSYMYLVRVISIPISFFW